MGDYAGGESEGEGDCEGLDGTGPQADICIFLDVDRKKPGEAINCAIMNSPQWPRECVFLTVTVNGAIMVSH